VCSANLCRSVIAAEYARRAAASHPTSPLEWQIASAGTDVAPGQGVPPRVARAMRRLDIGTPEQQHLVAEADVRSAHVILTAERYHRAVIARRFPFAVRYTFTLLEFARYLEAGRAALPEFAVRESADLLTLVRHARGHVHLPADAVIDIADPLEARSGKAVVACARTIEAAIAKIVV
jgi:protein-tyrosine phosphatase